MTDLITFISIVVAITLIAQIFMLCQLKEEKRLKKHGKITRTKAPNALVIFFLIFAVGCFAALVIAGAMMIKDNRPLSSILIATCVLGLFSALGFFGFSYTEFRYEVFDDEKVTVRRCFKTTTYYYKDVAYYSYLSGFIGGLKAYDQNGITLFASEGINVGIQDLVEKFRLNNIQGVPFDYFAAHMQNNTVYQTYAKRRKFNVISWLLFGFGIFCIAMFGLVLANVDYDEYQNEPVSGIVQSYEFGKTGTFTLTLSGDDNTYYVNNLVYKILDKTLEYEIEIGNEALLHVGYKDKYGRMIISQLEINGKKYLDMEESERIDKNNNHETVMCAYVFLGLGCALVIAWVGLFAFAHVKYKSKKGSN